jgi:H2-forming N5,N10-methylenetetrahydromethanopterin dehydrogenase-like enzyme
MSMARSVAEGAAAGRHGVVLAGGAAELECSGADVVEGVEVDVVGSDAGAMTRAEVRGPVVFAAWGNSPLRLSSEMRRRWCRRSCARRRRGPVGE